MKMPTTKAKFHPGRICITPGCATKVDRDYGWTCLVRHLSGDWGLLCEEDKEANCEALRDGLRILSAYPLPHDPDMFWIITEADRSVTTLLLPSEY